MMSPWGSLESFDVEKVDPSMVMGRNALGCCEMTWAVARRIDGDLNVKRFNIVVPVISRMCCYLVTQLLVF